MTDRMEHGGVMIELQRAQGATGEPGWLATTNALGTWRATKDEAIASICEAIDGWHIAWAKALNDAPKRNEESKT